MLEACLASTQHKRAAEILSRANGSRSPTPRSRPGLAAARRGLSPESRCRQYPAGPIRSTCGCAATTTVFPGSRCTRSAQRSISSANGTSIFLSPLLLQLADFCLPPWNLSSLESESPIAALRSGGFVTTACAQSGNDDELTAPAGTVPELMGIIEAARHVRGCRRGPRPARVPARSGLHPLPAVLRHPMHAPVGDVPAAPSDGRQRRSPNKREDTCLLNHPRLVR